MLRSSQADSRLKNTVAGVLAGDQLQLVSIRKSRSVEHVDVRAPVVPAASGHRRPGQDGIDDIAIRHSGSFQQLPGPVIEWTLA
jgi:hypothetical protein